MEIREQVTQYTVSAVPEDYCLDYYIWDVEVVYQGNGLWSVDWSGRQLNTDGELDWPPRNSEQTDEWRISHRFPLEKALELAHELAPKLEVNGFTPAQILEKYK